MEARNFKSLSISRVLTSDKLHVTFIPMIRNFRHKGLLRFFQTGDVRGINAQHADRIRLVLTTLNVAAQPADMNLPGLRLHPLKGERKGMWAVTISGNWRIVFTFDTGDAADVNLVDYH